ncbi:P1 family peptidase [Kroppenstedtia eburnea]|uniref:DmpA family aminopeptidase n=1 Tax=Kroppenstedtia eburnea TaxID=714067 RepID=UPI00362BA651
MGMSKKRLREYSYSVGRLPTGVHNSITDVARVQVGHTTLNKPSQGILTGVTAILPHDGNPFQEKVAAAVHVINGFGKTTGLIQVEELGVLESPILLTNTFSVPAATEGGLRWLMKGNPAIGGRDGTVNVVTAECNDGLLNEIRGLHVRPEHALEAIQGARGDCPVAEGAVGAGTGMVCFGWKGGIGTASRRVSVPGLSGHIGSLVLTNFGDPEDLTILGVPMAGLQAIPTTSTTDGSIIIVLGTDLPLDSRQLKRLAKRATFGLARTGSIAHHGSGDIVIAFSNAHRQPHRPETPLLTSCRIAEDGPLISLCFRAAAEATEEAILNSLFLAETATGRDGRTVPALPRKEVIKRLRKYKELHQ